jgi:hypothetical protein
MHSKKLRHAVMTDLSLDRPQQHTTIRRAPRDKARCHLAAERMMAGH